jgi:antitoxin FitA
VSSSREANVGWLLDPQSETTASPKQRVARCVFVVALQIRGVSEPTRRALSTEARVRGESLQEYLLDLLDREAHEIENRRLFAELAAGPLNEVRQIDLAELIRSAPSE